MQLQYPLFRVFVVFGSLIITFLATLLPNLVTLQQFQFPFSTLPIVNPTWIIVRIPLTFSMVSLSPQCPPILVSFSSTPSLWFFNSL
jgi:urea transporter